MVEHGGTTVIKKKRKAEVLRGAVLALFIAGLGAVLSSAKAQGEGAAELQYPNKVCGIPCSDAMRKAIDEENKIGECKHQIILENMRNIRREVAEGRRPSPRFGYSKWYKGAAPRGLPPRPATKKAKTNSIKFDPDKIGAGLDKDIKAGAKKRHKAAPNRIKKC